MLSFAERYNNIFLEQIKMNFDESFNVMYKTSVRIAQDETVKNYLVNTSESQEYFNVLAMFKYIQKTQLASEMFPMRIFL